MKSLVAFVSFAAVLLASACGGGDGGQPGTPVPTATTAADGATPEAGAATGEIAFVRDNQIYVMNADGSGLTRLTTGGGGLPSWSPVP